ncbi:major facilitator superfamily domain-containing protein [Cercophora scortea]|uniref:Major facilitator superfamily domain-containing protein n=1 Tax=Cercophora scortea TaxID=314031 RepID=A0AAE0MKT7_9PEZI|nr:major facilitator superfamily domain-containing protein [Cercophora scortea]
MPEHQGPSGNSPIWNGVSFIDPTDYAHELPGARRMQRMIKIIDQGGFSKRLFFVGFSGFIASSYSLFATNVIKPELYYVYPPCGRLDSNAGMVMDELTLLGTLLGMLFAGHLADLWGRKRLYGFELAILIVATMGMVQASEGFRSQHPDGSYEYTMDIYSWVTWWRFILGVGIGSEYPLVAVITAEWVATKSRGRMLVSVFSMQTIARVLAFGVNLAALKVITSRNGMSPDALDNGDFMTQHVIDQVWRWVAGVALIPAVIAVGLRLTIPETPRYYADIVKDVGKAIKRATQVYRQREAAGQEPEIDDDEASDSDGDSLAEVEGWYSGAWRYLRETKAGRDLLVISGLWALNDIAWYCIWLDSPSAMSTLWHDPSASSVAQRSTTPNTNGCPGSGIWRSDPGSSDTSIFRELEGNSIRFMLVVSIGSVLGALTLIFIINRFHRKRILMATFSILALLFAILGGILVGTDSLAEQGRVGTATDVIFGIMHFFFNLGPKTLILVIAVEIFPTVYRGSFYGIAAATGKLGAIIIRPIIGSTGKLHNALGIRLLVVVPLMLLAVWMSSLLPEVQRVVRKPDVEEPADDLSDVECPGSEQRQEGEETEAESVDSRGEKPGSPLWFHLVPRRLETMTLEDIAPSPALALSRLE